MTEIEINKKAGLLLCDLMESDAGDRLTVIRAGLRQLTPSNRERVLMRALLEYGEAWDAAIVTPENRARLAVNIAQARAALS
ncbi:hypothetical protein [Curtobacterium sp. L1-20]|uniref:hypothetical protein n=1 Tax=Curtobacterium sp. L1-20 TaxID=3138181 RepID=UPI003B518CAD